MGSRDGLPVVVAAKCAGSPRRVLRQNDQAQVFVGMDNLDREGNRSEQHLIRTPLDDGRNVRNQEKVGPGGRRAVLARRRVLSLSITASS